MMVILESNDKSVCSITNTCSVFSLVQCLRWVITPII